MVLVTVLLSLVGSALAQPVVAVVVVDEEARHAGYALEIGGFVVDDALPIDVKDGELLHLLGPKGEVEALDVAAGEAWEITGPDGEAWMAVLDDDVRTDRIVVRGSDEAIANLAVELGAELVTEGDTVWLAGEGILFAAARVDGTLRAEVDGISLVPSDRKADAEPTPDGAKPVGRLPRVNERRPVQHAPVAVPAEGVESPRAVPALEAPLRDAVRPARPTRAGAAEDDFAKQAAIAQQFAGTYLCRTQVLTLNAGGVFTLNGAQGRWRPGAPGVVRLETFEGELVYRASILPETRFCREIWGPDTIP